MADYIDKEELQTMIKELKREGYDEYMFGSNYTVLDAVKNAIKKLSSVDAVEVIKCKDCVYWQDEKVKTEDGKLRDYLPDEKYVTIDKGINVEAHCTLHGFEDMSGSWFWAQANDFCSRGVKKNEQRKNN